MSRLVLQLLLACCYIHLAHGDRFHKFLEGPYGYIIPMGIVFLAILAGCCRRYMDRGGSPDNRDSAPQFVNVLAQDSGVIAYATSCEPFDQGPSKNNMYTKTLKSKLARFSLYHQFGVTLSCEVKL